MRLEHCSNAGWRVQADLEAGHGLFAGGEEEVQVGGGLGLQLLHRQHMRPQRCVQIVGHHVDAVLLRVHHRSVKASCAQGHPTVRLGLRKGSMPSSPMQEAVTHGGCMFEGSRWSPTNALNARTRTHETRQERSDTGGCTQSSVEQPILCDIYIKGHRRARPPAFTW